MLQKIASVTGVIPIELIVPDDHEKFLEEAENGSLFNKLTNNGNSETQSISSTELQLMKAWEKASPDDKAVIAAVLKKYGFYYFYDDLDKEQK